MGERREPVLLVAACDFGWGSLGKLRLVLDELPGLTVAPDPGSEFSPTVRSLLGGSHRFSDCRREDAALGLVINDPRAADELAHGGLPVIYVDSLPYLWTLPEEVPRSVAAYCAQRSPASLPAGSPLADRHDIIWVDPLAPRARGLRGGSGIVINVGGLHSHLTGDSTDAYVRLAVIPLARLLAGSAHPVAAVCGNLPDWSVRELRAILPDESRIGPLAPAEFERLLRRADTLITSPGSTTVLQAAALGLRISLLPPQNLSQILNVERYCAPSVPRCDWPAEVIDRARVDALRPSGEDAVLEYIYGRIAGAATDGVTDAVMTDCFAAAIDELAIGGEAPEPVRALGFNGASQVARVVRQALFAPLAVPRPATANGSSHGRY